MAFITVRLAIGPQVTFQVDVGGGGPAFFLLSVRKSGSSVFNDIGRVLAEANGHRFVDVGPTFFYENVLVSQYQRDPALLSLLHPGNVYGGFRDMPLAFLDSELFWASPRLLMVRDPRDALVSEFFSNAYSHPIPRPSRAGDEVTRLMYRQRAETRRYSIDGYVVARAGEMARTMLQYEPVLGRPGTTVFRYEDYIFRKPELIEEMAAACGWSVGPRLAAGILCWADARPEREDPTAFVRRVTPGDHREKLRPDTIRTITETLAPAMQLFGYPTEG